MSAMPKCGCCEKKRMGRRKPPMEMTQLSVRTGVRKLPVFACDDCDGPVVDLSRRVPKPTTLDLEASTRPEDG